MPMVFWKHTQLVFAYRISAWDWAYGAYLKILKTTLNSLFKIAFKKLLRINTDIIYFNTYNLLNLKRIHIKEI